jgi:hypothetical protein
MFDALKNKKEKGRTIGPALQLCYVTRKVHRTRTAGSEV